MMRGLRIAAHGVFTLIVGSVFALPGAFFLLGHAVVASTGAGAGSGNLESFLLVGGFGGGCALGFFAFRLLWPRP